MKRAKVSELKARLSAYLAEVRRGKTVLVCDRMTPIARLIPFEEQTDDFSFTRPTRPVSDLRKLRPVRLRKPINIDRLLREAREDR